MLGEEAGQTMQLYEILFGVPVLLGVALVAGTALGLAGVDGSALELSGDLADDGDVDGDGLLASLGVGRVPLAVLLMLLFLLFGGVGLALYPLLEALLSPTLALTGAWLTAGALSLLGTRLSSRAIARMLPSVETYASTKHELIGQAGTVVARLSPNEVVLRVLDRGGAELRVKGLVRGAPARVGETLVVTYYEEKRDAYWADRLSLCE
jgi:membrane protein implicated in regulation of membrane protease activity